ncbi:MAG: FixH family protein [Bacteroidia bacterium]|jgi:nitrogen fixation protein FixH|nr:FixH family protein [Bacteroidia bacterium]
MNWGLRIALLYGGFVAGVVFMVIMSSRQQIDLVRKDYYSAELKHQDRIDETNNANALSEKVMLKHSGKAVEIKLPAEMKSKAVNGTALFYRPSDANLDRRFELKPDTSGIQTIASDFAPGIYNVQIEWKCEGKAYYSEVVFTY